MTTSLGQVLTTRRGDRSMEAAASEIGISQPTLSRLERGTHRPSADTALKLARWLGWSLEQVFEAAGRPLGG